MSTIKENAYPDLKQEISGNIRRYALQEEVDYWATELRQLEEYAVQNCNAKVKKHNLEMTILMAEYQLDCKKITFFYDSKDRVDFVPLLKELYREFGCRIWMEKCKYKNF